MKRQFILTLTALGGAVLYSWLFWHAPMGLNTLIFALFAAGALVLLCPSTLQSPAAAAMTGAVLLTAALVTWHHSILAKLLHIVSFILLIGYAHIHELRFIFFAFLLGISGWFTGPFSMLKEWSRAGLGGEHLGIILRWSRLVLIPCGLTVAFFLIYYQSNAEFAALFKPIENWLDWLLRFDWPVERFFSLLAGFLLVAALLWPSLLGRLVLPLDERLTTWLERRRQDPSARWFSFRPLALQRHYWTAILTLGLLNGLVLVLNATDLRYVWMEFGTRSAAQLSRYVHEGTYALIFSILLAMAVLLYFFTGNLNFYPGSRRLRQLAYAWLGQNALLALSVGLRNWHYILNYGLTYNRLLVLTFLVLVLHGLWTLYEKIRDRRTLFFLVNRNAWAAFAILLLMACINWDLAITRYNLRAPTREGIDVHYLLQDLSDQNLFLLRENRSRLLAFSDKEVLESDLKRKEESFRHRTKSLDWRSWNWIDWRNRKKEN